MSGKVIVRGSYPRSVKTMQTGLDSHLNGILLKNSRDSHMHRHTCHIYLTFRIHFLFFYKELSYFNTLQSNTFLLLRQCIHTQKYPNSYFVPSICLMMVIIPNTLNPLNICTHIPSLERTTIVVFIK